MGDHVTLIPGSARTPVIHRPPFARLCVGEVCAEVEQGGVIGRSPSAALRVRDSRISEGHAMLSLRDDNLVLLGLRQKLFTSCGTALREIPLEVGVPVGLVRGIDVIPEVLHVPPALVQVAVNEEPLLPLVATAYSLRLEEGVLDLRPGYAGDAAAFLVWRQPGWCLMTADGSIQALGTGDRLVIDDNVLRIAEHAHPCPGADYTTGFPQDGFPMRVVVRYDTVHLHRADRPSLVLSGLAARIVSELVHFGVPVPWEVAAREIWTDGRDRHALRKNWDRHLGLLRRRLRDARYPDDLVRPDGSGNVEVFVRPGDQLIDQT